MQSNVWAFAQPYLLFGASQAVSDCHYPPLTDDEFTAIQRRLQAASPGPWKCREGFVETATEPSLLLAVTLQRSEEGVGTLPGIANAEFIAQARTDIPRLMAEVVRLRERLARTPSPRDNG